MNSLTLNTDALHLDDEQFFQLCQDNRDLQFERNANGTLMIMPPTGGETGRRNFELCLELGLWNRQTQRGIAFDSSTGFKLPNGANRSPDAAWIPQERWEGLTTEEKRGFLPLCPDFVVELRSPSDALTQLQGKMQEYVENGTRLGWLIDLSSRTVHIYRPQQSVEVVNSPLELSGEGVLPGLILNCDRLW
ncbi:Uma2 family endonuclease [Spirulina subsalsa FACHB-351]|uniref:Uma2 family endonuclease n=1 Tax=Spirulina subsalsa FACHB-351 TaxID=234711 RepID=A0ABT3L5T8_9CYAN|nr:Uma2 family endonuclease [Spirulina subsalsa]MCW6036875.1 Uma2 family endonuclease [Spirulina subsalsa FACHB-351]